MSYTAFISYNTSPEEQVFIYRLQTLAAAGDITVLLPQRNGQRITNETRLRIDRSDCVIVFLTSQLTPDTREELSYAEAKQKLIIPIYEKDVIPPSTPPSWISYDPRSETPGAVEQKVLNLLKDKKKTEENKQALLLVGLGLGLLALILSNKS
ncbi:MAG TPA: toll/interleukin-1 receptor domain-containing protein [Candidatus Kryptobacter bacterium]|nr:toll/interleukin-1 receptor domain-containing protein [Candidatus Kryptobacter bacterium]